MEQWFPNVWGVPRDFVTTILYYVNILTYIHTYLHTYVIIISNDDIKTKSVNLAGIGTRRTIWSFQKMISLYCRKVFKTWKRQSFDHVTTNNNKHHVINVILFNLLIINMLYTVSCVRCILVSTVTVFWSYSLLNLCSVLFSYICIQQNTALSLHYSCSALWLASYTICIVHPS